MGGRSRKQQNKTKTQKTKRTRGRDLKKKSNFWHNLRNNENPKGYQIDVKDNLKGANEKNMGTTESLMTLKQILHLVSKKPICEFSPALSALKITLKVIQTLSTNLICTDGVR